ncbi:hypothetical protein SAMN05660916_00576 [Arthrobacter sp. 31Cvi3.1E]|uniref:hypothetical protein n=1 Tax=Paenarthrobacter nicotinovorans TaxID=29320 RepID=UPI0009A73C49|nr:hypothetical protein SAMN05660916_00576 [Arthrobacter sp. 31Cvi3.1E]
MNEPTFEQVRIKGTDLIGTRAFFNSPHRWYRTSEGSMEVVEVYFPDTGEIRQFNEDFLEQVNESDE